MKRFCAYLFFCALALAGGACGYKLENALEAAKDQALDDREALQQVAEECAGLMDSYIVGQTIVAPYGGGYSVFVPVQVKSKQATRSMRLIQEGIREHAAGSLLCMQRAGLHRNAKAVILSMRLHFSEAAGDFQEVYRFMLAARQMEDIENWTEYQGVISDGDIEDLVHQRMQTIVENWNGIGFE